MPVSRTTRIESVFLNIPYDSQFENLYTAYVVGLTQLGLKVTATLGFPNQDRLEMIFRLIETSSVSIHDLSRIEASRGIPRFNMPLELGIALHRARASKGAHTVHVFESKRYRVQRSTSDINRIDPQIHGGTVRGVMAGLRNVFRQPGDVTTVPEMLKSYRAVRSKLPELKKNAGSRSLFAAAVFDDLKVAALVESQKLIRQRRGIKVIR